MSTNQVAYRSGPHLTRLERRPVFLACIPEKDIERLKQEVSLERLVVAHGIGDQLGDAEPRRELPSCRRAAAQRASSLAAPVERVVSKATTEAVTLEAPRLEVNADDQRVLRQVAVS